MNIFPVIPANTRVKLTKVSSFGESEAAIGSVRQGLLKSKVEFNRAIFTNDGGNTSPVMSVSQTKGGDYIVTTQTSLYFMQVFK